MTQRLLEPLNLRNEVHSRSFLFSQEREKASRIGVHIVVSIVAACAASRLQGSEELSFFSEQGCIFLWKRLCSVDGGCR
jgi:hypothetical protein